MRRGAWFLAAVLLLALLGAATWIASDVGGARHAASEATNGAASATTSAKPTLARKPKAESTSIVDDASATIPPPVDLDAVDRSRDLHGVVVRRDGTPVEGAAIVAVSHPWRRTDFLVDDDRNFAVDGPRTRSAADGTFALRLRRGVRVQLRVAATGFPTTTVRERQAGERVRIVLDAGVRLRVSVLDADNRVLPGLKLQLVSTWSARIDEAEVDQFVVTDSSGEAVVDGLPPRARFYVEVRSDGFAYPGRNEVVLADSGETTFRLVLSKGRTLRGRVVDDATDVPVAGARVGMGWSLVHAVPTDVDGRFEIAGWSESYPEIEASANGYAQGKEVVADRTQVDFRLRRGFAAAGRIVDGAGRPVRGALVGIVASVFVDRVQRMSNGDAVTGADGRFRIEGLTASMLHVLVVVAEGFGRVRRPAPGIGDAPSVDLGDVALPPGQIVAGHVFGGDGKPAPRVPVVIVGPTLARETGVAENDYGSEEEVVTDDLGRFTFADLAAGEYELRADVPGASDVKANVVVPQGLDVEDVRLAVAKGRQITVRLVDDRGAPVRGICVRVMVPGRVVDLKADTADDGIAQFDAPDVAAQFMLDSEDPRCLMFGRGVFHHVPADGNVSIVLHDSAQLAGVVHGPSGKPVPRAMLRFVSAGRPDDFCSADDAGRFNEPTPAGASVRVEFVGVAAGEEPGLAGSVECVPPATGVVLDCVKIAVDRALTVKVTSPDGAAVPGAAVEVQSVFESSLRSGVTDAQGLVKFVGLPARPVVVGMAESSTWALPVDATVTPDGQQIVLSMRRAAEIRGVVVDAEGKPVKSKVWASVREEGMASAAAGDDGRFVLRVPADVAGPYRLDADEVAGEHRDGAVDGGVPGGAEVRIVVVK